MVEALEQAAASASTIRYQQHYRDVLWTCHRHRRMAIWSATGEGSAESLKRTSGILGLALSNRAGGPDGQDSWLRAGDCP